MVVVEEEKEEEERKERACRKKTWKRSSYAGDGRRRSIRHF